MLSQTWCQIKMFRLQTKYYKERLLQLVVNNGKSQEDFLINRAPCLKFPYPLSKALKKATFQFIFHETSRFQF